MSFENQEAPTIDNLLAQFKNSSRDISFFLKAGEIYQYWVIHEAVLALYYSTLTTALLIASREDQCELIKTIVILAELLKVIYTDCLGINKRHGEAKRFIDEVALSKKVHRHLNPDLPMDVINHGSGDNDASMPELIIIPANKDGEEKQTKQKGLTGEEEKQKKQKKREIQISFEKWCARIAKMFREKDSKIFREFALFWNWLRLCLVRVKKVINTFAAFFKNSPTFRNLVAGLNTVADPIFSYLSWLFFLPRLFLHLSLLAKHTFPNIFKKEAARKPEDRLKMKTRFCAHGLRRWFPLGNDLIWMIAGVLGCFVLGPAAPFVMILSLAFPISTLITTVLYVYDIGLAGINAWMDSVRVGMLKKAFAVHGASKVLNERVSYENKKLAWLVAITAITCVGAIVCFILPIVFPGVAIPFVGALLLLSMSFVSRYCRDYVISPPKDGVYTGLADAKEKLATSQKKLHTEKLKLEKEHNHKALEPLEKKLLTVNTRYSIFSSPSSATSSTQTPPDSPSDSDSDMIRNVSSQQFPVYGS